MIQKFLDLSTGHLPQKEFANLNSESDLTIIPRQYGFMIWLPGKDIWDEIKQDFPDSLDKIMQYAYKHDCWLINFDSDADKIDELEYYDW